MKIILLLTHVWCFKSLENHANTNTNIFGFEKSPARVEFAKCYQYIQIFLGLASECDIWHRN